MITDNIQNIAKYSIISEKVSDFLKSLTPDFQIGHYVIDDCAFANIDVYNTKDHKDCKFEAHKKYIDIQMLLYGKEQIDVIDINSLEISVQYNEQKDVMFFKNTCTKPASLLMTPYKFAVLFPNDAHKPQMNYDYNISLDVKKVVVKILA